MLNLKRILLAVSLVAGAVLIAAVAAWRLVDDTTLLAALDNRLQAAAGVRIHYAGAAHITRTLSPTLSVERLTVEDRRASFQIDTDALKVQVSLPKLLFGQLDVPVLQLGNTRITLLRSASGPPARTGSAGTGGHVMSALALKPVLHDVQIGQVSLVRDGGEVHLPPVDIDEIRVNPDRATDTLALSAQLALGQESFHVDATLPDIYNAVRRQKLGISLAVTGRHGRVEAEGEIALDSAVPAVDARVHARGVELPKLPVGGDTLKVPGTLTAEARLAGPFDQLALEDISAVWRDANASQLTLEGSIGNLGGLGGAQLHAAGSLVKPLWLTPLLPKSLGSLDSAELQARISGTWPQLAVRDLDLRAKSRDGLDVSMTGRLDIAASSGVPQPENLDLALAFGAPTTRAARILLFDQVPELGALDGKVEVRAGKDAPRLENIVITTRDKDGIQTDLRGNIARFPLDPDEPNSGYDLDVVMKASRASVMVHRLGEDLPLSGPFDLAYRIEGDTRALALKNIRLTAGEAGAVKIGAQGQLQFGNWSRPDPLASVDLQIQASSRDSKSLGTLFGDEVPDLGGLDAQAHVHTVSGKHRVDDLEIRTADGAPVQTTLTGSVGDVRFFPRVAVRDVRLKGQATAGDVAQLNSVFGLAGRIPALGPLTAQASIQGGDNRLDMDSASVRVGTGDAPAVRATGSVEDLLSGAARTRWNVQLNIRGQTLAGITGRKNLSELGALAGSMVIDNSSGALGITSLAVRSSRTRTLDLAVNGRFPDFGKPETLSLTANLAAPDLQHIGKLLEQEWPPVGPVAMKTVITQSGRRTEFDAGLTAGDIRGKATISADYGSNPIQISGRVTAQNFFVPELTATSDTPGARVKPANSRVFSDAPLDLDWLRKADVDLAVEIDSFSHSQSNLESARFVVTQKDGRLSVRPATLVYPNGKLDLDLQVDAQDPPRISFRAYGKNLNPWNTLEVQKARKALDSDLDIDVAVKTSGRSLHELAGNLDGNAYITMQNGKIRRVLLDAMVFDVVGWTVTKATREKYYDIDCGVADFAVRRGVVTTNAFLLDGRKFAMTGEGSIDLGREQIEYVLLPKNKARLIKSVDPVKITGALSDPSVRVIPWKSAATTYGGLVFAPYIFVGVAAADYLTGALELEFTKKTTSPCQAYEDKHKSADGASER